MSRGWPLLSSDRKTQELGSADTEATTMTDFTVNEEKSTI